MPSTGDAPLQDTGRLSYNGVVFSALFRSEISGEIKQDQAGRTVMYCEYTLSAEGIVSAADGVPLETNFVQLRQLLEQDGGELSYGGRGFGELVINVVAGGPAAAAVAFSTGGTNVRDVAWGPKPEVLFFQPLGNGLSAMVRWRCKFTIPEQPRGGDGVLQFSYSCGISFDEDFYSLINFKGVFEVPLTRANVGSRVIPTAVADTFRATWLNLKLDATKYRVKNRSFDESADRRRIDWSYSFEELPPQNLPPGAPRARGTFDVQPIKQSNQTFVLLGIMWSCSLKVSYTIRKDLPRRQAMWLFLQLLQFRMNASQLGTHPAFTGFETAGTTVHQSRQAQAMLSNFSFHEGLHLDSKIFTCDAQWALFTTFRSMLDATGVWRWPATQRADIAAASLQDVAGWKSWLANSFNTAADIIVDFGGGAPPLNAGLAGFVGPIQQPFVGPPAPGG